MIIPVCGVMLIVMKRPRIIFVIVAGIAILFVVVITFSFVVRHSKFIKSDSYVPADVDIVKD